MIRIDEIIKYIDTGYLRDIKTVKDITRISDSNGRIYRVIPGFENEIIQLIKKQNENKD